MPQIIHISSHKYVVLLSGALSPGTSRCFRISDAVLRCCYQDRCPLYPSAFQPCISPYLIHSIHAKLFDITWQWCLFNYHPSAYRIRIPVNVFYFWKINAEPAGDPVFDPCDLFLCLNTKVGQISDLCIDSGWNIWIKSKR